MLRLISYICDLLCRIIILWSKIFENVQKLFLHTTTFGFGFYLIQMPSKLVKTQYNFFSWERGGGSILWLLPPKTQKYMMITNTDKKIRRSNMCQFMQNIFLIQETVTLKLMLNWQSQLMKVSLKYDKWRKETRMKISPYQCFVKNLRNNGKLTQLQRVHKFSPGAYRALC